jgi:hypothetical protein
MSPVHEIPLKRKTMLERSDVLGMPRTCHEYVTCFWDGAAFSQQLEKVPELAVDITTYRDRT